MATCWWLMAVGWPDKGHLHKERELWMCDFSTDPQGFQRMTTDELRKAFLIDTLFAPDEVPMTYSDIDRSITGSAVPGETTIKTSCH